MAKNNGLIEGFLSGTCVLTMEIGVSLATGAFSTESLGGDSVEVYGGSCETISATPDGATASSILSIPASTIGGTTTSIDSGPDAIIYFRNSIPYALAEKRAERICAALKGKFKTSVLITDTREGVSLVERMLGNRMDAIEDNISLYAKILND